MLSVLFGGLVGDRIGGIFGLGRSQSSFPLPDCYVSLMTLRYACWYSFTCRLRKFIDFKVSEESPDAIRFVACELFVES